jgi:hypothetical protein
MDRAGDASARTAHAEGRNYERLDRIRRSAALRRSWPDQAVFQVSIADGPEPTPPLATVTCRLAQIDIWNPNVDPLPQPTDIPTAPDPVKAGMALLRSLRLAIDACVEAGALGRIAGEGLLIAARDELDRVRDRPRDRQS